MRSLLDVREQYLNEFSFPDPYAEVSCDVRKPFQTVGSISAALSCLVYPPGLLSRTAAGNRAYPNSFDQYDPYALFAFVNLFSLCFSII